MNQHVGLLVNSSRGIIYASDQKNFAEVAHQQAQDIQLEMAVELEKLKLN
jgi:orotidine-5'-phosphate decarboxylase